MGGFFFAAKIASCRRTVVVAVIVVTCTRPAWEWRFEKRGALILHIWRICITTQLQFGMYLYIAGDMGKSTLALWIT